MTSNRIPRGAPGLGLSPDVDPPARPPREPAALGDLPALAGRTLPRDPPRCEGDRPDVVSGATGLRVVDRQARPGQPGRRLDRRWAGPWMPGTGQMVRGPSIAALEQRVGRVSRAHQFTRGRGRSAVDPGLTAGGEGRSAPASAPPAGAADGAHASRWAGCCGHGASAGRRSRQPRSRVAQAARAPATRLGLCRSPASTASRTSSSPTHSVMR